jgi:hypothetical protein
MEPTIRETGIIEHVFFGKEDHGILTCYLRINFDGSSQSFGGVAFANPQIAEDFIEDLCRVFGVSALDELRGKPCVAYRCYPYNNELIEALEASSGARFVLTDWRRKHWPDALNPKERRREQLRQEERRLRARLKELGADLDRAEQDYRPVPL